MKDAKGHGSNKRGEVGPSNQAAIQNLMNALRAGVGAHSAGIHAINRSLTLAQTSAKGTVAAPVAAQQTIHGNPGGTGTEEEWAEIRHQHYKEGTR